MQLRFPLSDVIIEFSNEKREVKNPLYVDEHYRLNQREFSLDVDKVGWFYAADGNYVNLVPDSGVSEANLELYLNGSTYGAILHQRGIIPLHASCFVSQGLGIMLCGKAGAGKSSLTTCFVLDGNEFLTDDVTPIVFPGGKPFIWAMSDRVKLWEDSINQLKQKREGLNQIDPETQKFYLPLTPSKLDFHSLDHIFLIDIQEEDEEVRFQELKGSEKLTALRNEIYRPEYLEGMPKNEALFFPQLASISNQVRMTRLIRPRNIPIEKTKSKIINYLQDI